jgi:hypothetical protein
MSHRFAPRAFISTSALLAAIAVGCSDTGVTNPNGPITAGLSKIPGNDSGTAKTGGSINDGPGYFHGTVLGTAPEIAGNDSLALFPKLGGVVVTIYPLVSATADTLNHGPAAGSVVTDAAGQFQLPTLPAGDYVITFVPPSSSAYRGVYAFGPLRSNSKDYPWWVVLAKK